MDARKLIEAIENVDTRELGELRARSYSGRAMYGKDCVGVEIPGCASAFQLAAAIAWSLLEAGDDGDVRDVEDLADLKVCEDAMGCDTIVYFPQVAWPDDVLDEEDDDHPDGDCDDPECCTPTSEAAAE